MATIISDEVKRRLIDSGLWADFVRRRADVLARGEAESNNQAAKMVLAEMDPGALEMLKPVGRPSKRKAAGVVADGADSHVAADSVPVAASAGLAEVRMANRDAKARAAFAAASARTAVPEFEVTKETFAGKSCSYSTSLNWAYSNYRIADVSPDDAPSAVAWNLLLDIRESPSFKADVLKGWSNAMARKAETDEQDANRFDGEGEYDMLAAIARAGGSGEGVE